MQCLLGLLSVLLLVGSFKLNAVTIPEDLMEADRYDWLTCVADLTQNCITTVCLRSTERHCQDDCEQMAAARCRQQYYN